MARPSTIRRNRATPDASSDRLTSAPSVRVNQRINPEVRPNALAGLAQALGVGANAVLGPEARRAARRRQVDDQVEARITQAKAEVDARGGVFDEEAARKDPRYEYAHDVQTANRIALESGEKFKNDLEEYRREYPLADEAEIRAFASQWGQANMIDEDGNPIYDTSDPVQEAIVGSVLEDTQFKFLQRDREIYRENLRNDTANQIEAAHLSAIRTVGQVQAGNYEDAYRALRMANFSHEEANDRIYRLTLSTAEQLDSDEAIKALPERWENGEDTPWGDPAMSAQLDSQGEVYATRKAAAEMKALEPLRLEFRKSMATKAERGIPPTAEEEAYGLSIGMTAAGLASYTGSAARALERMKAEQERANREAVRHEQLMTTLADDPYSVDNGEAEDGWSTEFQKSNDPEWQQRVIFDAIDQRRVLPGVVRNYINAVPSNPQDFENWSRMVGMVRDRNEQVYASLGNFARTTFEASEAMRASGRFTEEQIIVALQRQDPERGETFVRSRDGQDFLEDVLGSNATPASEEILARITGNFAAMDDLRPNEVTDLARKSFESTYFIHEGRAYPKKQFADADAVEAAKYTVAEEQRRKGNIIDPDDIVINPLGDGSQFAPIERGALSPLTLPATVDELRVNQYKDEMARIRQKYGDYAVDSYLAGQDPTRNLPNENAGQGVAGFGTRLDRMNAERGAAREIEQLRGRF